MGAGWKLNCRVVHPTRRLSRVLHPSMIPRVPHPNVVLFDVRVGLLTLFRLGFRRVNISASENRTRVKIPTLPKSGEGWGTLKSMSDTDSLARPPARLSRAPRIREVELTWATRQSVAAQIPRWTKTHSNKMRLGVRSGGFLPISEVKSTPYANSPKKKTPDAIFNQRCRSCNLAFTSRNWRSRSNVSEESI